MRGQVLGVDKRSGEGQISGEDGNRYTFTPADWSDSRGPAAGVSVDFAPDGARALKIFHQPGGVATLGTPPRVRSSDKNRIVAALLALFLGALGVHRFYLGRNTSGLVMLLVSVFGIILLGIPTAIVALIAFVQFVLLLLMSDEEFERRYETPGA